LQFEPTINIGFGVDDDWQTCLLRPLPENDPIGEAWILSDRDDHASHVANGRLKGQTISQLMEHWPVQLMGKVSGRFSGFHCC